MNRSVSLFEKAWRDNDTDGVTGCFIKSGFRNTGEIMETRLYELLNINRLNSRRVEEMITALYRWYNPNPAVDEDVSLGILEQCFRCPGWRKEHKDLSLVTVGDIVLIEDINKKAVVRLYNTVVKAFYRSDYYDRYEYKYWDYDSLKRSREYE